SNGPVLVRVADVLPQRVEYVWPGRIPCGKLAILAGLPGLGKSIISLDIAARESVGGVWPDGGAAPGGDVIILSAEDGPGDTIRPRLELLGADLTRVHVLTAVRDTGTERAFDLTGDITQLESAIALTKARLVLIDPVDAYLGTKVDSYKNSHV